MYDHNVSTLTEESAVAVLPACPLVTSSETGECEGYSPDVALADEHTGVVNGLSEAKLEHQGLQAALKEIGDTQGQHVIELHLGLVLSKAGKWMISD